MSKKDTDKSTHRFRKSESIIYNEIDEYALSKEEFYCLYSFYVTYSMCGTQSMKKRSFIDYGWETNSIECIIDHKKMETSLGLALSNIIDLNNGSFCFLSNKGDLTVLFTKCDLGDGNLTDFDTERAVVGKTTGDNKYLKLFYRIRDGFAHGKFILKYSSTSEKMVVIQDDDSRNVTARIVLKLSTLLSVIEAVDINNLIIQSQKELVETVC